MLQDMALNVMTLTLLLMTATQCRRLLQPTAPPPSSLIGLLAVWLISICAALPYLVYTTYLDMEVGRFRATAAWGAAAHPLPGGSIVEEGGGIMMGT